MEHFKRQAKKFLNKVLMMKILKYLSVPTSVVDDYLEKLFEEESIEIEQERDRNIHDIERRFYIMSLILQLVVCEKNNSKHST